MEAFLDGPYPVAGTYQSLKGNEMRLARDWTCKW